PGQTTLAIRGMRSLRTFIMKAAAPNDKGQDEFVGSDIRKSKRIWRLSPEFRTNHLGSPATLNRYVYGGADPINNIDPSGNDYFDTWWFNQMYPNDAYLFGTFGDVECIYL